MLCFICGICCYLVSSKSKKYTELLSRQLHSQFLHASTYYSKIDTINENHSSYILKYPLMCKIAVVNILQIWENTSKNRLKNKNIPRRGLPNINIFFTPNLSFCSVSIRLTTTKFCSKCYEKRLSFIVTFEYIVTFSHFCDFSHLQL